MGSAGILVAFTCRSHSWFISPSAEIDAVEYSRSSVSGVEVLLRWGEKVFRRATE